MKIKTTIKKGIQNLYSHLSKPTKSVILCTLILTGSFTNIQAQDTLTQPSWWFGIAGGANFNFYDGSTNVLNENKTAPVVFNKGNGIGLFLAPLVEFHKPGSKWGIMLQAGYDGRSGDFDQKTSPCNCPRDLSTQLSYLTVEPSLRFAPFTGNLYLFAGPRLAFNLSKSFTYKEGPNPEIPNQVTEPDLKGDFSNIESVLISMQIGAGYDIPLSSKDNLNQFVLSPFVSFHPYFGQSPRSIETWNNTTVRAGIALKFGRASKAEASELTEKTIAPEPVADTTSKVVVAETIIDTTANVETTSTDTQKGSTVDNRVRESFPLRNYVYFDNESTEISSRYVLLKKDQVIDFKANQLEISKPKTQEGRASRQMIVYYNILNILGDRMQKNPTTTIKLIGSSEKGAKDGEAMAASVKTYLVNVFEISGSRITVEGKMKPKVIGKTDDIDLIREENRKVTIESSSPILLAQFQSGTDTQKDEVLRYSVIFDFNKSKTSKAYEKYLTEIVTPKIPAGGTVVLDGYADIIGNPVYNQKLSLERTNEVMKVLKTALSKAGKNNVKFETKAFGEDTKSAQFNNKYPEERSYNRSVVIDIIVK